MEYWGYEDGDAVRRVEDCAQDEIVERLKKTIPLRGSALPSIGLQIALVYYESGIMPPLGVSLLNEINEALGLPNYHHHFSSMVTGAVGIFLLPDNNWCMKSLSCYLRCINIHSLCAAETAIAFFELGCYGLSI